MPQHFVASPQWEWYIVWYFFLGGLAGGAYPLGTILRLSATTATRAWHGWPSSSSSRPSRSVRSC